MAFMEQKKVVKDDLMTLSEASQLLGLSSFRSVNSLIKRGKLKAYRLPMYEKKKFVAREEVNALMEAEEVNYGS
tara:strand:- start:70 stop:291 length:222 start_codon:yes stop_codon:yes gene_type:complete